MADTTPRPMVTGLRAVHPGPPHPLSPRLLEVLMLVAEGRTVDEIALELDLSPHTVRTYLERIFERLGAQDRVQAVTIALRTGLMK